MICTPNNKNTSKIFFSYYTNPYAPEFFQSTNLHILMNVWTQTEERLGQIKEDVTHTKLKIVEQKIEVLLSQMKCVVLVEEDA